MAFRRRQKLIQPGLQLRLVLSMLGIAVLGVMLQFLLIHRGLMQAAGEIPGVGGELAARIPAITVRSLVVTMLVLVPLLSAVGIWRTFRFAGPVYRFECFLREVAAGRQVKPCQLRKGDELLDLCELINEVTEPLREEAQTSVDAEEPELEAPESLASLSRTSSSVS